MTIDFDDARIAMRNGNVLLTVTGKKRNSAIKVSLDPVVYIQMPDYWQIDVNGQDQGMSLPVITPYRESKDITRTIGHQGIVVHGANKDKVIKVAASKGVAGRVTAGRGKRQSMKAKSARPRKRGKKNASRPSTKKRS